MHSNNVREKRIKLLEYSNNDVDKNANLHIVLFSKKKKRKEKKRKEKKRKEKKRKETKRKEKKRNEDLSQVLHEC